LRAGLNGSSTPRCSSTPGSDVGLPLNQQPPRPSNRGGFATSTIPSTSPIEAARRLLTAAWAGQLHVVNHASSRALAGGQYPRSASRSRERGAASE
jgi:hypothetical protein